MREDRAISNKRGVGIGLCQPCRFIFLSLVLLSFVCSCATTGQGKAGRLPNESVDFTRLERENAELKIKLDDALERIVKLSRIVDEHQVKLDFLADKIRSLEGKRGNPSLLQTPPIQTSEPPKDEEKAGTRAEASRTQNIGNEKPAVTAPVDPQAMYEKGVDEYRQGQFRQAMVTFKEFLTIFHDTPRASNAQYWLGESYYSLGDFSNAMNAFSTVLQKYPLSGKIQDAMLKKGYCLVVFDRREEASVIFQQVIDQFPTSVAAEKAREKLKELSR